MSRCPGGWRWGLRGGVRSLILPAAMAAAMPAARTQGQTPADQIIYHQTFEAGFPADRWTAYDNDAFWGSDYWGVVECKSHYGTRSLWCNGVGKTPLCVEYEGQIDAYFQTIVPIDTSGHTGLVLTYWVFADMHEVDRLWVYAGSGESLPLVDEVRGVSDGWVKRTVSLPDSGEMNMVFRFRAPHMPAPGHGDQGVYIDDIELAGCPVLTQPVGLNPAGKGAYACGDTSTAYSWNTVPGASAYRIQWMDDLFRPPIAEAVATGTVYYKSLPGSGRRWWRVRAETSCGTGPWSALEEYALRVTPGQVSLLSPAAGTQVCSDVSQRYSWNPAADATQYRIQWDTNT